MAKKSNRIKLPWDTAHGTVNVGDKVAYLAVCTKVATMSVGTYLGYIENDRGERRVQIEEPFTRNHWAYKDSGKRYNYQESWNDAKDKLVRVSEEVMGVSTLKLNRIIPLSLGQK